MAEKKKGVYFCAKKETGHNPQAEALTGALIAVAKASQGKEEAVRVKGYGALMNALAATVPGEEPDAETLEKLLREAHLEKDRVAPDCAACKHPCGRTLDYDMREIWDDVEPLRGLRVALLRQAQLIALLGEGIPTDPVCAAFVYRVLDTISDYWGEEHLLDVLMQAAEILARELLLRTGARCGSFLVLPEEETPEKQKIRLLARTANVEIVSQIDEAGPRHRRKGGNEKTPLHAERCF